MSLFAEWGGYLPPLLRGLAVSVRLAALALAVGCPIGLTLAVLASARSQSVRAVVITVVELGRGAPALVVLQLVYFGLPSANLTVTSFLSAALALAVTAAAYTSEILRGGLQAVPQGEVEAAQALGLSRLDTLRYILVPQGVRIAIPALMGFAVLLFQATALAFTIAVPEILSQAYSIGSATFRYLSVLLLAGLLYAAITIPASFLSVLVGKRLSRHL